MTAIAQRAAAGLGVVVVSTVVGLGFGLVAELAGPYVMVGLPVLVLIAVAVLDRPRLAPMLVVLSLPIGLAALPGTPLQVVEGAVLLTGGLVLLRRLGLGQTPLPWHPSMWWAAGLVGCALLSTAGAFATPVAIKTDAALVAGVVLALTVLAACRTGGDIRRVVWLFLAVGTVMAAIGLTTAGSLQSVYGGGVVHGRLEGTFGQPNELGSFSAMVLMVSMGCFLGARSGRERLGAAVAAVTTLAALLLTLSRSAWIGTVLGGVVLVVLLPGSRRVLAGLGIPVVLAAALFGAFQPDAPQVQVVKERLDTITDPAANPYDDRPSIWQEARREIDAKPWLGWGPGNFREVSARSASRAQSVQALHAHNALLTVGAEVGLPAVAMVLGFTVALALALRRALKQLRTSRDAPIAAGVGCALVAMAGQGLLDYTLTNAVLFLTVWLLVGLTLSATRAAAARA